MAALGHTVFYGTPLTGYDFVVGFQRASEKLYVMDRRLPWRDLLPEGAIILMMSTDNNIDVDFLDEAKGFNCLLIYDYIDHIDPRISLVPIPESHLDAHAELLRNEEVRAVCVAPILLQEVAAYRTKNLMLVPNGVDVSHYEVSRHREFLRGKMREIVDCGRQIVGYFGALASWVDYQLVHTVARSRPNLSFVLVGPEFDGSLADWRRSKMQLPDNLFFIPPVNYEELPLTAIWFDVAMIPFVVNEITAATSPLKLYEYFALGKPVVSTPIPDCAGYPDVVLVAEDADRFAAAVDRALVWRTDEERRARLRRYALQNDWMTRACAILRSIDER
ncbi:MAG: glycosyltransferase [Hyphomicrobium sp.]|jgi:hypothetical protein